LFKNTNIKPAFKTKNTVRKHLFSKQFTTEKYENPGIYKLKCMDCPQQYIGQTGRNFKTRYKEHVRDIRNNRKAHLAMYNIFSIQDMQL
jgi:hypothetical protein